METTLKGEIVKDYLQRFPKTKKNTLARIIYKENQEVFKDKESVRDIIRYYRGKKGIETRTNCADKTFYEDKNKNSRGFEKLSPKLPEMPEGLATLEDWQIEIITGDYKILVLSDVHIPFHSKKHFEMAIERGIKNDVDFVLLNGDFLDFYGLSRWEKDPRIRNFMDERVMMVAGLNYIRSRFPKARIVFKEGNHEERYECYMATKAAEIFGIEDFEFEKVFRLNDFGIEYVKNKRPIKLNELFILHGHEYKFNISNPVNPARGLYMRTKVNSMCGHFHQSSNHSESNLEGKYITTWSIGHLGDPHPKYMPLNKWNWGFAEIETCGDRSFQVHNYKIIDDAIYRT